MDEPQKVKILLCVGTLGISFPVTPIALSDNIYNWTLKLKKQAFFHWKITVFYPDLDSAPQNLSKVRVSP